MAVLLNSDFPDLQFVGRGKGRDICDLVENLLIVTTDRISAFDVQGFPAACRKYAKDLEGRSMLVRLTGEGFQTAQ